MPNLFEVGGTPRKLNFIKDSHWEREPITYTRELVIEKTIDFVLFLHNDSGVGTVEIQILNDDGTWRTIENFSLQSLFFKRYEFSTTKIKFIYRITNQFQSGNTQHYGVIY